METVVFQIQRFSIHDGPGIRTTVFFKGCNLRCDWCCNPEGQCADIQLAYDGGKCIGCGECVSACPAGARRTDGNKMLYDTAKCVHCFKCLDACVRGAILRYGRTYTLDELCEELLKDQVFWENSGGGVTLSGGEVLLQAEFVSRLCDRLHALGVHVAVETAAALPGTVVERLLEKIDLWQVDCKHCDELRHKAGTGVGVRDTLENIRRLKESGADCIVRIPVIPDFNDTLEDARRFSALFLRQGIDEVQLMPFHQFGESKYAFLGKEYSYAGVKPLHKEELEDYKKVFEDNGIHVQIGG